MDSREIWRSKFEAMCGAVAGKRVTPPLPPEMQARIGDEVEREIIDKRASAISSWSLFIHYSDATQSETKRRISCLRLVAGLGGDYRVMAYCHERGALRAFLLDRIISAANVETGEDYHPRDHFMRLRAEGLPFADDGIATFSKICSFMAKCDGYEDPAERVCIETAIGRYALRFGGNDQNLEQAIASYGSLAPGDHDFVKCIASIKRSPHRKALARLTIDTCADIIDADGIHTDEEVNLALHVSEALKTLAV